MTPYTSKTLNETNIYMYLFGVNVSAYLFFPRYDPIHPYNLYPFNAIYPGKPFKETSWIWKLLWLIRVPAPTLPEELPLIMGPPATTPSRIRISRYLSGILPQGSHRRRKGSLKILQVLGEVQGVTHDPSQRDAEGTCGMVCP